MGRGEYYRNKYGGGGRGGRGRGDGGGYTTPSASSFASMPPLSWQQLGDILHDIHNRNYGAYHDLERVFAFASGGFKFRLVFDHIQGDPYASPSRAHVQVDPVTAGFPAEMYQKKICNIALCDYLTRKFAASARSAGADAKTVSNSYHGAKGGDISIDAPGQHVIERSSVMVLDDGTVEARFNINLPARGRSVCGDWAYTILVETLPKLVERALVLKSLDNRHLWTHIHSVEDQEELRGLLKGAGLVGFIRDGAILPRESGASDLPLSPQKAILFKSPPSLSKSFTLQNSGPITGMGIPAGVTLFVGGGFHGKTTVLKALEVGIYNHVPTDGREFVVMDPNAVKIRSEDSRSVVCTDISSFIDNLPFKQDTTKFSTADASGSTSQAANIVEALEVGATTLLIDEDTCATNFMIRDWKMQQLVAKEKEPITPFISKVRALYNQNGVSSVLVIGGAGDYFSVADHVIMMDSYEPRDVTKEAKQIAKQHGEIRQDADFGGFTTRIPLPRGFEVNGKVVARGLGRIQYGEVDLDLAAVEQIVEPSQVRAIADAILKTRSYMDGKRTLTEVLDVLEEEMNRTNSLDLIGMHKKSGFYTRPRRFEQQPYPSYSSMRPVNRTVRQAKTVEWPKRPGGVWKNGWYEDTTGMKWYSDVVSSSDNQMHLDVVQRQFNMRTGEEVPASKQVSSDVASTEHWGPKLSYSGIPISMTSVAIANGKRYGLFLYAGTSLLKIENLYDWETLLSNAYTSRILLRWFSMMAALYRGYLVGGAWSSTGIGCLANFSSFKYLPVMLLPRLKMISLAFCATGCQFEGQQRSLSDAWFVVYPAIVELMLLYCSLLNLLAKLLSRRVSDVHFGPSVPFLCLLHWLRLPIAMSGWFEFDGRITALIPSDEVDKLKLLDFFTTKLALRANGNIKSLFFIKIAALAVNLLPLIWSLATQQPGANKHNESRGKRISDPHCSSWWVGQIFGASAKPVIGASRDPRPVSVTSPE